MAAAAKPPQPGLDAFHRERSKCIDAFAALEEQIIRIQVLLDMPVNGASFGEKVEALKGVKASPRFAKARVAKLKDLLIRCQEAAELRNDIVHSRLQLAVIADEQRACFANTRHCQAASQVARLFTLEGLRAARTEATSLTDAFTAL